MRDPEPDLIDLPLTEFEIDTASEIAKTAISGHLRTLFVARLEVAHEWLPKSCQQREALSNLGRYLVYGRRIPAAVTGREFVDAAAKALAELPSPASAADRPAFAVRLQELSVEAKRELIRQLPALVSAICEKTAEKMDYALFALDVSEAVKKFFADGAILERESVSQPHAVEPKAKRKIRKSKPDSQ